MRVHQIISCDTLFFSFVEVYEGYQGMHIPVRCDTLHTFYHAFACVHKYLNVCRKW